MFSKFIQVSAVACALALGGTAVANNNGGTQGQSTQPQPQPQGQMQQGQMQGQQGQTQGQQQTQQQQGNTGFKSVRLTSLDQNQIKEVQTRLKDVGFYRGQVDGVLGTNTRSALVSYFQQQASLVQQGRISDQALSGFGFGANDIERVRGVDTSNTGNQGQTNQGQTNQGQNQNQNNNVNNDRQNTRGQQ